MNIKLKKIEELDLYDIKLNEFGTFFLFDNEHDSNIYTHVHTNKNIKSEILSTEGNYSTDSFIGNTLYNIVSKTNNTAFTRDLITLELQESLFKIGTINDTIINFTNNTFVIDIEIEIDNNKKELIL